MDGDAQVSGASKPPTKRKGKGKGKGSAEVVVEGNPTKAPKNSKGNKPRRESLPAFSYCDLVAYWSRNAIALKVPTGQGVSGLPQARFQINSKC